MAVEADRAIAHISFQTPQTRTAAVELHDWSFEDRGISAAHGLDYGVPSHSYLRPLQASLKQW